MNYNFSFFRLLLFAACLGVFAALGGFSPPQTDSRTHLPVNTTDAWLKCMGLFITGAVCVSLVDHRVGNLEPTNLRPLYIFGGVIVMVAALFWMKTIKETLAGLPPGVLLHYA